MSPTTVSDTQSASTASSEIPLKKRKSWDGWFHISFPQGIPELTILKIISSEPTDPDWHTHPISDVAYVLSGHINLEKYDGSKKIIHNCELQVEIVDFQNHTDNPLSDLRRKIDIFKCV